ncbi:MAG: hypothetical protein HYV34_01470 [Candidatus Kerfeldbacteria bacterium]|nr:hypothetical protein [Candidatus Kerfeldbacteria bacterium]
MALFHAKDSVLESFDTALVGNTITKHSHHLGMVLAGFLVVSPSLITVLSSFLANFPDKNQNFRVVLIHLLFNA